MKLSTLMTQSPIGIDVGTQQVKLVQLAGRADEPVIAQAAVLARARPGAVFDPVELERIWSVIERRGFRGRQVVLTVPPHKLIAGILDAPAASAKVPMEQIARMELSRTHRREPQSLELAWWPLPAPLRPGQASRVYAAACTSEDADEYIHQFEQVGFEVSALDIGCAALARACLPSRSKQGTGIIGILDVGWLSARLMLLHQGVVVFERSFEEGGVQALHRTLTKRFSVAPEVIEQLVRRVQPDDLPVAASQTTDGILESSTADALEGAIEGADDDMMLHSTLCEVRSVLSGYFDSVAQELNVSFSYVGHQYDEASVDQLLLVGGGAAIQGMDEFLANGLEVATRVARPRDLATCRDTNNKLYEDPALMTALGLARWRQED